MKRRLLGLGSLAAALVLAAGGAQAQKPQYGGNLEIVTVSSTLSALSWDPGDFAWKTNHDNLHFETLFAGDLDKSVRRGGNFNFRPDAWISPDAMRGELAESWEWQRDPLRVVVKLRKGIMWPAKPGVMESREFVADDVVFTFNRQKNSPKSIKNYFFFIDKVEAIDRHTVAIVFNEHNSDWDYRFGWGYYSAIYPEELVKAGIGNWRNAVGTGPFQLDNYVQGNLQSYARNPNYWDTDTIDGQKYKLPFVDRVTYRIMRDEATQHTALRTGKIDILESISWTAVDSLKKSAPQLQWSRWLNYSGTFLSMRVDTKPFDDIRVRRALNLAVNQAEIAKEYYGGHAELFAYPQHPDYIGYFEPLESMPDSVKELFTYNPTKAKQLLREAGYPNGFTFPVQVCSCSPDHMELLPMIAGYLEQVGVKMQIQPLEYGAFLSAMTTAKHTAGYFMNNGHTNPTRTIHKSFTPGQLWGPSMWSTPEYTARMNKAYATEDEKERQQIVRELTREVLEAAPYIWLPIQYRYTAWWPWVKNYDGELRVGAVKPGPIYARIWLDQELKKKMGY
jgi:peptide/nickel transport system substrate-binding protein